MKTTALICACVLTIAQCRHARGAPDDGKLSSEYCYLEGQAYSPGAMFCMAPNAILECLRADPGGSKPEEKIAHWVRTLIPALATPPAQPAPFCTGAGFYKPQ
jgi:hypothetical protein